ncbi:DUF5707 domain-containing protein [Streptomyces sp. NPDC000658]|uniref:DUF5707 domain-containing protein n=1 Tax=Streptomyces sp. NPDC000658 TaxID=3154266 RepID=UPI003321675F
MSKRILFPSLIGAVVLGGVAAGGLGGVAAGGIALASTSTEPTLERGSARYTAPTDGGAGSLAYTVDVSDDSGVRSLKVLAWPASSELDPTPAELRSADESAKCRSTSDKTARCTYGERVTKQEAADLAKGTWYVSVLVTAKDGGTTFVPRAATFEVTR